MKKLIYIAIAALTALTACTKVEMDSYAPQRKVTFQVASYAPQTKANSSMWTLGSSPSFTAKAFLHADGYTNETQNFFGANGETITPYKNDGTAATAESNTSYWGPSHDYYWPKSSNSYINFIAWRGATPFTATETSLSWKDYTVQSTDDLIYADEAWHYNVNTTNAAQYTDDAVTSGVPMLFHHALAKVAFQAKVKDGLAPDGFTHTVTITKFELKSIYSKGSLTLTNSDPANDEPAVTGATTKAWSGSWTGLSNTFDFSDTGSHTLSTTATSLVDMRTVLPQAVSDAMVLTVEYTISTTGGSTSISENVTFSDRLIQLVPVITAWEMGHIITYTLEFDPTTDSIVFSPTLKNWDSTIGGGGVTLE